MLELVYILLFLGIIAIIIEIFTAGFGVFGISGICLFIASVIVSIFAIGPLFAIFELISIGIFIYIVYYIIKNTDIYNRIILKENLKEDTALIINKALIGNTGITKTDLKPFGNSKINDAIYEVTSNGGYIQKDKEIIVTNVKNNIIYVDEV